MALRLLSDFLEHCHVPREELFKRLNLRIDGKDWRSLAGKLNFKWTDIQTIEQRPRDNPCERVLSDFLVTHPRFTLVRLCDILRSMQREDAVGIIENYLYDDSRLELAAASPSAPVQSEDFSENYLPSYAESVVPGGHRPLQLPGPLQETHPEVVNDSLRITAMDLEKPIQGKIALLIGNQGYEPRFELRTPHTDIKDLKTEFEKLDFQVMDLVDLTKTEMAQAILKLTMLLGSSYMYVAFVFAGHGFEAIHPESGVAETYLMPVDASFPPNTADSLPLQESILDPIQECNTAMNLIIVDTCRLQLPGGEAASRKISKRSINLRAKGNTVFAFSTSQGMMAFEYNEMSPNPNSIYVSSLKKHLCSDDWVERILKLTAQDIVRNGPEIGSVQVPAMAINLIRDCKLKDRVMQRYERTQSQWESMQSLPPFGETPFKIRGFEFQLKFHLLYKNVLFVSVFVRNKNSFAVEDFQLSPDHNQGGIEIKVRTPGSPSVLESQTTTYLTELEIHHLQRAATKSPGSLQLALKMSFREVLDEPQPGIRLGLTEERFEIDLGEPPVAAISDLGSWMDTSLSSLSLNSTPSHS